MGASIANGSHNGRSHSMLIVEIGVALTVMCGMYGIYMSLVSDGGFKKRIMIESFNYIAVIIIMMLGLWAMIGKKNIIKKLIGMAIFQTGLILFYISMGAKKEALYQLSIIIMCMIPF